MVTVPGRARRVQDNLTWTVRAAQETYDWNWDSEEVASRYLLTLIFSFVCNIFYVDPRQGISYLPLSHVAAQVS